MVEYRKNSYEDSDLKAVLEAIEAFEDEKRSIRAEAAGKCSQIAKRIENEKKTAKNLGIPLSSLGALLKTRKLERQIADIAEGVPDEEVEIFEDMTGQFSFLAPAEDAPEEQTAAQVAAAQRKAKAAANEAAEQEEGAKVISELTQVH